MEKIWSKGQESQLNIKADDYNTSIHIDSRMYRQDIRASIAHAKMLVRQGIIEKEEFDDIEAGLKSMLDEIDRGELKIDMEAEDIHSFVEAHLTKKIGEAGKKLHTARSRNDQVATDFRLYLRDELSIIIGLLEDLIRLIIDKAGQTSRVIMPGYTHLQRAQPITFGHYLLAYGMMFDRDIMRLKDASGRMNLSPLGSGALAGTSHNIDRNFVAKDLGFDGIILNSLDGVSDRDFCIELNSAFSIIMMHLSRFCEEIILWASNEFAFIEIDEAFSTGSSIMPQKKNPDIAELIRGKTGRVYGNLMAILTILKALPLAYNKDLQEDKENIFDSLDTVKKSLDVFIPMLASIRVREDNMLKACKQGFINSTDLADYLVKKGIPFRTAYKLTGAIIAYCIDKKCSLEEIKLEEYKHFSTSFEEDLYEAIKLDNCVNKRLSLGGPSQESIKIQIDYLESRYATYK